MTDQLLTCKELASALRRNISYVYAMRRRGFKMPGNVSSLRRALHWLERHGGGARGRKWQEMAGNGSR